MQHTFKFQLIKTTTYLFLSISFRYGINKCFNKTCNMYLSFRNLILTPTKNLLSKFQNLYIYIHQ